MLRIKKSEFVTSVGKNGGYPSEGGAEIAIVGKSNVGKSSIINSLCNMNKLAKTSQKPGKTRLINYFRINGDFYIVDLPGYGFAGAGTMGRTYRKLPCLRKGEAYFHACGYSPRADSR